MGINVILFAVAVGVQLGMLLVITMVEFSKKTIEE